MFYHYVALVIKLACLDFYLSKGRDVIKDFSLKQGDQIVLPEELNPLLLQRGDNTIIRDEKNAIRTTMLNVNRDDLLDTLQGSNS